MSGSKAAAPEDEGPIHLVTVDWRRGKWSGTRGKYSREHVWHFAGRLSVKVSDALAPVAYRDTARLDPLKSYVATIASAHMLAWLHAAFSHEAEVESYLDTAEGVLSGLPEGRCWVSEVILKPPVTFSAHQRIEASAIAHFHELAQHDCFIAQSIKTKVTVRAA
jgi:organic hydroperoxide reductase OsmC/OhrA